MSTDLQRPISIFISAASNEFEDVRGRMAEMLQPYADVHVQTDFPNTLHSADAIRRRIEEADLVICLIGHHYGAGVPDGVEPHYPGNPSWTQWEYLHAREVFRAEPCSKRLAVFMDRDPPAGSVDERQESFRARVYSADKATGGLFFMRYSTPGKLLLDVDAMMKHTQTGLAALQYSYWVKLRKAFQDATVRQWRERHEPCPERNDDPPPFIPGRGFSILPPDSQGRQLRYLKPEAFLTGRTTETELSARRGIKWTPLCDDAEASTGLEAITRVLATPSEHKQLAGVNIPAPIRLFIVSGSGIGKSTTLHRIEAGINGLDADLRKDAGRFAVLLQAENLEGVTGSTLIESLMAQIIKLTITQAAGWQEHALRVSLAHDLAAARVVVIIDGLDHVGTELRLLRDCQITSQPWTACPILVAGRPHSLHGVNGWHEQPGIENHISARYWRFLEPQEFTDDEAKVYLGKTDGLSRFDIVAGHIGDLVHVPRVLEYVRTLDADRLRRVRTASDIYYWALQHMVVRGLTGPARPELGVFWGRRPESGAPSEEQVERMIILLSALAFTSFCATANPAEPVPSQNTQMKLDKGRQNRLAMRLAAATSREPSAEELKADIKAVCVFSTIISNGILEDLNLPSRGEVRIMWANRTIQPFFAALWLSSYAAGSAPVRALLAGSRLVASRDPAYDVQRTRHYVFLPEADLVSINWDAAGVPNIFGTDTTYEFNRFLAEMPDEAILQPASWIAAISAWYDPDLFNGTSAVLRVWSSEMLYRSWARLLYFAGIPLDDWWDTPYARLVGHPPGLPRDTVSPHQLGQFRGDEDEVALARFVLDRFRADFRCILDGGRGAAARKVALDMIADCQWKHVPDCPDFMMGAANEIQGCPTGKVDAYWQQELLDPVQTGAKTAEEAARRGTWPEWFIGKLGEQGREGDVEALRECFAPVAAEGIARGLTSLTGPDRTGAAYREALAQIGARFKTHDETPEENPQAVRAFQMHRLPVLHRWYRMFAPGHALAVSAYFDDVRKHLLDEEAASRLDAKAESPPDNHPVMGVSWYDAWAFCQWTNWRDPKTDTLYGLRLPHEPEWEFAARWTTEMGKPVPSDRDWRWWWNNELYQHEDEPVAENITLPRVNADGRPGHTRPPAEATPNGLGFHDILGNVWEWMANIYHLEDEAATQYAPPNTLRYSLHYPPGQPPVNPQRTMRGGLWYYLNVLATCANRFRYVCNDRDFRIGFRVVRELRTDR